MSGNPSPLTCCDNDCAMANGCRVGGYKCSVCGLWYCHDHISYDGWECICDDCKAQSEDERED